MISFKFKLVAYFVLLSLLPLTAAYVGFRSVSDRTETRVVDAQLESGLRAGLAAYEQELAAAAHGAEALALNRTFQRALADRDERELRAFLRELPNLRVEGPGGAVLAGHTPPEAAEREVAVLSPDSGRELGAVVAAVPLDAGLAEQLRGRSGLEEDDAVVLLRGERILAASSGVGGTLRVSPGAAETVRLGGTEYRARAAEPVSDDDVTLVALSPQARIDAANASAERRLLLSLLASLLFVTIVAWIQGRAIVRTVREVVGAANAIARGKLSGRVPVRGRDELALLASSFNEMAGQLQARLAELDAERSRLREATMRFGETLAATHDVDQLLRLIVETATQSTGAVGGILLARTGEVFRAGDPDGATERIELPLIAANEELGELILVGHDFSAQDVETAALLVGHAAVALDNARLHAIVERQALADGLTGLANRRFAEEALATEVSRAARYGGPLSLVFADLDGFKDVNDRWGHPSGDAVLREFAVILRENLREVDVAARWGGEEFALVLPGTGLEGAVEVAERVRLALEERVVLTPDAVPVHVTASFGVAGHGGHATKDDLIAAADQALYEAKRAGKNRVASGDARAHRP